MENIEMENKGIAKIETIAITVNIKREIIKIIDFLEELERICPDDVFDLIKSIVNDLDRLLVYMYPDPEDLKDMDNEEQE
jgi:hypothetical protein